MQHNELMEKANVSSSTFYKLKNGENVTTDILLRICDALELRHIRNYGVY